MSKIEPGCRVIVVRVGKDEHHENLGRTGVVVEAATNPLDQGDWWVKPDGKFWGWVDWGHSEENADETSFRTPSLQRLPDLNDEDPASLLAPLPKQDEVPA